MTYNSSGWLAAKVRDKVKVLKVVMELLVA